MHESLNMRNVRHCITADAVNPGNFLSYQKSMKKGSQRLLDNFAFSQRRVNFSSSEIDDFQPANENDVACPSAPRLCS
jgi:hypothetical protein